MKLKKVLACMVVLAMTMPFVACAKSSTEVTDNTGAVTSAPEKETPKTEEAVVTPETTEASGDTLTVAIWDTNQEPGLTKILADFTAATGIKAEIQVTPWDQYWTMLEAGATGGSLPDVFWMHSNEIAKYSEYEMLLDLTDRIAKSDKIDLSKFPEDIVNIYKWEGKTQYAVPKDIDTIALWYNKTMFDEAGLAYPDDTWTWDTFRDACEKLTKADGSQFGFALKPSNGQAGWYNMVYDMGGTIISDDKKASGFDQPGTIKAVNLAAGLVKDGFTPSYEVIAENEEAALLAAGKVAMVTQGSWMLAYLCNDDYIKANCDVAVLPKDATTGRRASIYNGLGWAADAKTDRPDDAWALIEYLGSQEAQQKQSDLGIVISAYEGTVSNWTAAYPNFNVQAYLDMMNDLVIRPYSKTTVTWENMINEKLVDAWTGTKTVEDVCADITTEMNASLASE